MPDRWRWLPPVLPFLYVAAIVLRKPVVVHSPSFWAEEGTRYFAFARSHGWIASLLQEQMGYLALWPNLACTFAARLVPLEWAPVVTTAFALVVQCLPVLVIVTARAGLFDSVPRKVVGVLVVLFALDSGEVWLNTINSQFYLSLVVFLVLVDVADPPRWRRLAFRGVLVLGGLTGIVPGFLLPAFAWSAWRERARERWVQAGILAACLVVQVGYLAFLRDPAEDPSRLAPMGLGTLVAVLWTRITLVFAGPHVARGAYALVAASHGNAGPPAGLLTAALLALEVVLFVHLYRGAEGEHRGKLLGSFVLLFGLSVVFSAGGNKLAYVDPRVDRRYFFVPGILLLLFAMASISSRGRSRYRVRNAVSALLLVSGLGFGVVHYRQTLWHHADFPDWRTEVRLWRKDPAHPIGIWPRGWTLRLEPRTGEEP